jgi:hypothetical protein
MDMPTKALRYYMEKYPNSFVGFFDKVSEILRTVGQEWVDYAFNTQSKTCHAWGQTFIKASKTIDTITIDMSRIRDEHDAILSKT